MTQPTAPNAPKPPQGPAAGGPGIQLQGGAAILAPITAFPNGVPGNALVLIPLGPNGAPVQEKIVSGPVALTMDEVWNELIADEAVPTVTLEAGHIRARLARNLITFASSGWSAIQIKQLLLRTVRNDRRRGSPIQS